MKARTLNGKIPDIGNLAHLEELLVAALNSVLAQAGRHAADRFAKAASLETALAAAAPTKKSAMVAVYPLPEQQALLARPGGEDADIIHCTLAFLGELDPDQAAAVVAALGQVPDAHSTLTGEVGGIASFGDNGDGHPSILLPDVHGLAELRHAVTEALQEAGIEYATNHGWTPHLTLSYEPEPSPPPAGLIGQPLTFDTLSVAVGDVRRDLALREGLTADIGAGRSESLAESERWIVTEADLEPAGMVCMDCDREFKVGDEYATRAIDDDISVIVCVDCAEGAETASLEESDPTEFHEQVLAAEAADAIRAAAIVATSDKGKEIAEVAAKHVPDGGYGDTYWNESMSTVYWIEADWTSNDEIDAAVAEFEAIDGVEKVETCSECAAPEEDGWELVFASSAINPDEATLRAAGPPTWTQPHPDELVDVEALIRQFRTKADPVRRAAIEEAMTPALKAIGIDFDATNPLVVGVYERVGQHITFIAETTRLNAMRIVRRAYEEGLSIPDTAKAIRTGMTAASAVRARLIARTEMTSLVNGASLAATRIIDDSISTAKDEGEEDAQDFAGYRKKWLTAPGAHFPRHEDYEGLDGQTVELDQPFDVGGVSLMYPGDPDGPPEEICNCRCTIVYVDGSGEETDAEEGGDLAASGAAVPFTDEYEGGVAVKDKAKTTDEALENGELAPPQDDTPTPMEGACANCSHDATDHAGELNDGACGVEGCDCGAFVAADASPDSEESSENSGTGRNGMTAFVRIRPEIDPEFHSTIANATTSAMRSGMAAAFGIDAGTATAGDTATFAPGDPAAPVSDVRPERTDGAEVELPEEIPAASASQLRWEAEFCPEGYATDDGRIFAPGSITWRELPLTLMAMTETPGEGGHAGAELAGRIERIWRDDTVVPTLIRAEGVFDDGEYGQEIARLVGDQTLRGNSVDLAIRRAEFGPRELYVDEDGLWRDDAPAEGEAPEPTLDGLLGGEEYAMVVRDASIGMSTVCPFPAFDNAGIVLLAAGENGTEFGIEDPTPTHWRIWLKDSIRPVGDVLTASAAGFAPVKPPAEWFDDPDLDELTPLTVTDDGRVYGHAWAWGECHIGLPGACVVAPHSDTDYAYFHLKQLEAEDGALVDVGTITLGTSHADQRASRQAATEHYDHTGTAVADVRIYEDEYGGAIAGALRPEVPAGRVREFRGSTPSGDWRKVNGNLELVGLLAVNVPGFPVPRTRALVASAEDGGADVLALVAAGIPDRPEVGTVEFVDERFRAKLAALAARAEGGLSGLAQLAASRPGRHKRQALVAAPVWDSENGLMDVMGDISAALNPGDSWRWYVIDVSISGDSAIVCDSDENRYYLVPLTYDAGEPVVPPQSEWTEVESEWVQSEAASAYAAFHRLRLRDLAARVA